LESKYFITKENELGIDSFNRAYEFEVQLPIQSLLRIQLWDWDMTSTDDLIAETKIDIENRWFSCHRATCGLPKRYDGFI
jgi:Ca2+-dependent lipid-binding protein